MDHLKKSGMLFPAAAQISGPGKEAGKTEEQPPMPDDYPSAAAEDQPDTQKLLAAAAGISLASLKVCVFVILSVTSRVCIVCVDRDIEIC